MIDRQSPPSPLLLTRSKHAKGGVAATDHSLLRERVTGGRTQKSGEWIMFCFYQ